MKTSPMKTSPEGELLTKGFEALRLHAYQNKGDKPTIGWGTTVYPNGIKVKLGDTCTVEQAEQYFQHDLLCFENEINKSLKVTLKQNQFDAMVDHWYNTGGSNTIMAMVNSKTDIDTICQWWCTHYITENGKVLSDLVMRREKEAKLFAS
jgi:lysozyme